MAAIPLDLTLQRVQRSCKATENQDAVLQQSRSRSATLHSAALLRALCKGSGTKIKSARLFPGCLLAAQSMPKPLEVCLWVHRLPAVWELEQWLLHSQLPGARFPTDKPRVILKGVF